MEEEHGKGVMVAFEAPLTREEETDGGVEVTGGSAARGAVGCSARSAGAARLQGQLGTQSVQGAWAWLGARPWPPSVRTGKRREGARGSGQGRESSWRRSVWEAGEREMGGERE
jgi:hypothetical protein